MKNLSLLLIALFGLALFTLNSCGDDDDNKGPVIANSNLEGTIWVQNSRVAVNCPDASDNENYTCDSECDAILLNTDGSVEIASDDGIFSVPYTKNGSNLMVEVFPGMTLDINYVITGKTMTITFMEDSCDVTEVYTASESLPLVGTPWEKIDERNWNCTDPFNNCESCTFEDQTIVLNSNGTGTASSSSNTTDLTYTVNANILTVEYDENGTPVSLEISYKIISDIMVIEFVNDDGCDVAEVYRAS